MIIEQGLLNEWLVEKAIIKANVRSLKKMPNHSLSTLKTALDANYSFHNLPNGTRMLPLVMIEKP